MEQKDVNNDVICKKRDMLSNTDLAKMLFGFVEQYDSYKHFVKIKLSRSKRRLSRQVNEIEQNDVTIDVISQKRDMVSKKKILRSR